MLCKCVLLDLNDGCEKKNRRTKLTRFHRGQTCIKTILHENKFALRVKFARVAISHGESFLQDSKIKTKYKLKKRNKKN